jgi:cytochrome c biogenesis protein CcdA
MDPLSFMETMGTSSIPLVAAFFIGLMMAISPCPMATNITAIAYISKKLERGKKTLMVGLFYALGRMITYVAIASFIVWFGLNMQTISFMLREYGEKLLGPLLICIGVVMLDILKINLPGSSLKLNETKEKLSKEGFAGSFILGAVFSLAFCPFSAVLFFGMLIPLAIKSSDAIVIPAVFAMATSLPVIIFSLILVYGVSTLSSVVNQVQMFERWMRRIVSILFILVGAYYTLSVTLGMW